MRSKSFAARRVRNVIVYVHTALPPSDAEWDGVLEYYTGTEAVDPLLTLVYSAGGAPNASQRARLNVVLGARRARIAVLTPSALARAAGTAVSLFRPDVHVFGPHELGPALEHLGVSGEQAAEVRVVLSELKEELDINDAGGTGRA